MQFDILRWTERGYSATRRRRGWLKSKVFDRSLLLESKADRLGHPQFFLHVEAGEPS